ncbi:inner membrane protein YhaI [mine drainage metagenome]|uniref:Inner membrane protein YhaI n=1 Tax=mine drainage metagenome TaxID=410659 RepID=A0A1J5SVF9_9ZZZZ
MGMVFCRGCGKEIHETAPTCPHCGFVQNNVQKANVVTSGNIAKSENAINDVPTDSNVPVYWFMLAMKKYAQFDGRSRRKEFWYSQLSYLLALILVGVVCAMLELDLNTVQIMQGLINIALLLPLLAVGVRRLHDTNRSGWWLLLPIVNIVFLAQDGTKGSNQYGADPKS